MDNTEGRPTDGAAIHDLGGLPVCSIVTIGGESVALVTAAVADEPGTFRTAYQYHAPGGAIVFQSLYWGPSAYVALLAHSAETDAAEAQHGATIRRIA